LAIWLAVTRRPLISLERFKQTPRLWGLLAAATLVGTYLAIWLQQISVSLAPAGIVQTLLSASPIFILPIAALAGEKLSLRAVLGVLVALVGVEIYPRGGPKSGFKPALRVGGTCPLPKKSFTPTS